MSKKTYLIAYQRFFPIEGKDEDYVLGSRFENNTFISDNDIDYGNGGSLGFQQTKGAVVVNNTFVTVSYTHLTLPTTPYV